MGHILRGLAAALAWAGLADSAAGFGVRNVVLLARRDDPAGLHLANHYKHLRGLDWSQVIRLDYRGGPVATPEEFERDIRQPTLLAIKERGLTDIVVWITAPGLPYRVGQNSISSAIHFGAVQNPEPAAAGLGPLGFKQHNAYCDAWLAADALPRKPGDPARPLHMALRAGPAAAHAALLDRAVGADGSDPAGVVHLCDGVGPRASRKFTIPMARRFLELQGAKVMEHRGGEFIDQKDVLGVFTGVVSFPVRLNQYVPGALADHLTSLGAAFENPGGQMLCTEFLDAGAAASFGAVVEPYNYPQKFPSAMLHAYYRAGFTAVEAYWMSVRWPQHGYFAGDPLCRPFGAGPALALASPAEGATVGEAIDCKFAAESARPGAGVAEFRVAMPGREPRAVSAGRIPQGAWVEAKFGATALRAEAAADGKPSDLVRGLFAQANAAKLRAGLLPSGLLLMQDRAAAPPAIATAASHPFLHLTAVGGSFHPGRKDAAADERSLRLDQDLAWLRFGVGPRRLAASLQVPSPATDGWHRFWAVARRGDETLAATSVSRAVVKKTKPERLRLTALKPELKLADPPAAVAAAYFERVPPGGTVEFRVDEEVVGAATKEPWSVQVDAKRFGRGKHELRARVTFPAPLSRVQEADELVEFVVVP